MKNTKPGVDIELKTFEIRNHRNNKLIFSCKVINFKSAILEAIAKKINLIDADLSGADLSCANLSGADLTGAYLGGAKLIGADLSGANLNGAYLSWAKLIGAKLSGADLTGADLTGADLTAANLNGAYLSDANLSEANLSDANLNGAYLSRADLSRADLNGAKLTGAYLSGADLRDVILTDAVLTYFKTDLLDILIRAPREIAGLRQSIIDGKIDGAAYEGKCACLVGTIANFRGCNYDDIGNGIQPDPNRPAEEWFFNIKKGDTPETNVISKITLQWIDEYRVIFNQLINNPPQK